MATARRNTEIYEEVRDWVTAYCEFEFVMDLLESTVNSKPAKT